MYLKDIEFRSIRGAELPFHTMSAATDCLYLLDSLLKALLRTHPPAEGTQGPEMLPTTTNLMANAVLSSRMRVVRNKFQGEVSRKA